MQTSPETARVDVEMNLGWAEANPELFVKSFREFQKDYPAEVWTHHIDLSRDRYVTLTTKRRTATGT